MGIGAVDETRLAKAVGPDAASQMAQFFNLDMGQAEPVGVLQDLSEGEPGSIINAGVGTFVIPIFLNLAEITANADVITNYTPGFNGQIVSIAFIVNKAVTTGSKRADFNVEINDTNVTGGIVSVTSAAATPKGAVISGSAISSGNFFTDTDTISIESSSVTAHAEGNGWLMLTVRNTDTTDAISSIAAKIAELLAALKNANQMAS